MIHVVLYQPEIPQNTGNIMRTCAAFGARLHLIEPLGFYVDDAHLRRSGMDYRKQVDMKLWHDWQAFEKENHGSFYFMTRYGKKGPDQFDYTKEQGDIYLVFGKESTGIDKDILRAHFDRCVRIPMRPEARCLNLSNTAAICIYEVMRQLGFPGCSKTEVLKGEDFILKGDHHD